MTLILAAKYLDGVMYCYDTVGYDSKTFEKSVVNKVLQANNTPLVRGVCGTIPDEKFMLDDIERIYKGGKRKPLKTMLKATSKYCLGSWYFNYNYIKSGFKSKSVRECANSYLFSWNNNEKFNLYEVHSIQRLALNSEYASIGSGSYKCVNKFLRKNFSSDMSETSVLNY